MTSPSMILATVSGSFHRHMDAIAAGVAALTDLGVHVISPADPRIVAAHGDFLFVASDRTRSVRLVQDRHLESLRASDFLWLVCPDGYLGQSASMEVGFAVAHGTPIFSLVLPADLTLRQYVNKVSSVREAVDAVLTNRRQRPRQGLLIDPHASIEEAHDVLDQMQKLLQQPAYNVNDDTARKLYAHKNRIAQVFEDERQP